ncbi:hypothetical protein H6G06_04500 [Anabaena sphaerica FACHB-251]|uniref:Uncharacterized protein n=1 Tax=Anabaena sphaerica FACHB-251 TaxID=2692883 RepID=A0A926ZZT1_9NOST|nr:hypothetical protein [Anabaena sphaerica]MBD2292763.1 hypothetical protein [Anabaena sphaerica FACHB-251]
MFKIGFFSAKLLVQGKLLRDPMYFTQQTIIGVAIGLLLLLFLAGFKLPLWLPVAVSSLVTGAVMPFLLKDLKMR